jgi:hypothetical protein
LTARHEAKKAAADREAATIPPGDRSLPAAGLPGAAPRRVFIVWKDRDSARQEAIRGIFRSTAMLTDKADADVLDLSKSTAGTLHEDRRKHG